MGCVKTIDATAFPKQGSCLNKRVQCCFNYDTSKYADGVCVRDDIEEPWVTIFNLDDGRHILATECQYHPTE